MPKRSTPFWTPDPYFRRAAFLAMLCLLPSLWVGMQLDDYFHWALVQQNAGLPVADMPGSPFDLFGFLDGDPERTRLLMEKGMLPWWALQDIRYAFWRPVVEFTHALDYGFFPSQPWLMHVHSLLWFLLMLWLAHRLYDLLLGADASRWATLVFALHYSHGLPAGWLANRNGLMATVFTLLAVLLHHRTQGRFSVWAVLAFATALLCGELGVSAGLLLFAYAVCLDRRDLAQRALSLLPYIVVGLTWLVLRKYFGYGAQGSGHYIDPLQDFSGFVSVFALRGADLLNGQFLLLPPEFVPMLPGGLRLGLAAVLLIFLLWYGSVLVRNSPAARFFALGTLLCLLPVAATTPHSRLLLCVGIGGCGLLGLWLAHWRGLARAGRGGVLRKAVSVLLVTLFCVLSPVLLAFEGVSMRLIMDGMINRAALSLPWQPEDHRRLLLVNPPLTSVAGYLGGIRAWHGLPAPANTYTLAGGALPLTIDVIDAQRLRVHAPAGVYDATQESLLRDPRQALVVGDTVALDDMQVTIEKVNAEGVPVQVLMAFAKALDAPEYRFMIWNNGSLAPCHWPAAGSSITLEPRSDSCAVKLGEQP